MGFFYVRSWNKGPGIIIVVKLAILLYIAAAISSHKISDSITDLSIYQPIKRIYLITSDNVYLSIHQSVYIAQLRPTFTNAIDPYTPTNDTLVIYIYTWDSRTPLSTHTFAYCQTNRNKLDVVYEAF